MPTWNRAGYMNLEIRRKVWVGDYQLKVIFTGMEMGKKTSEKI